MAATPHTVKRIRLGWDLSDADAARLVRGDARPFALIGRWAGGGAIVGSEPVRVAGVGDDPFALLDAHPLIADGSGGEDAPPVLADGSDQEPLGGGWVGYLGYGLGRRLEPVSGPPPSPTTLPPFALAFYDHLLRRTADGQWWFEALWSAEAAPRLRARLAELRSRAAAPDPERPFATAPWRRTPGRLGHERAVEACRRRIRAGDLFQANICVRLESELDGDPLDLFLAGVAALAPDRAAFLSGPWGSVASLSPELFLERRGRRVRSAPIKGTIRKPADPAAARAAARALSDSAKDRAENVMIVDLVRNDLGRVCRPGTVVADALAQPRLHTGVWHLVSEVCGELAPGADNAALVRAAFPPGSVTGAPKVAALNVIAELESTERHAYTGAIGFASPVADALELSVAIRTFEFSTDGTRTWLGVGGGIVADSDPAAEGAECLTKATPLLDAIGARLARESDDDGSRREWLPARRRPQPTARPDPAAGVFETLLVLDGRPIALEAHLARLADSVEILYGQTLPGNISAQFPASSARARLRVNARPAATGDIVAVTFEVSEVPLRTGPTLLEPTIVPGGIGAHKWVDRRLLDSLGTTPHPLICDLDGRVLETPRANVFIVTADGTLVTPPADGRILPGVTRADVLELASSLGIETAIRPVAIEEVAAAEEVFLTGSLAGIERARMPGNTPPPAPPDVAETLRTNLYKRAAPAILR